MQERILQAKSDLNSVGGVIEAIALHLPAGIGAPYFDSVESMLSHALFSVPAVKGVEFGDGFGFAGLTGAEANDALHYADGGAGTDEPQRRRYRWYYQRYAFGSARGH